MKLSTKVAELSEIIEPAVTACDVSLWGVEFVPQGRKSMLRIFIEALPEDKANGKQVTIEDCAAVTHQVGGVLDLHDPIAGEYMLEVSSPGLDRSFFFAKQFADYMSETVQLRLINAMGNGKDKRRKLTGKLLAMDEKTLTLELEQPLDDNKQASVLLDNIDKANLIYQL